MPTPFKTSAPEYCQAGLAVIPCGKHEGKQPLLRWRHLKQPPTSETLERWCDRYPQANIGIVTEPSCLTVVDCDDPDMVHTMLSECGVTPLIAETPRGGSHLYYKLNGEKSVNGFLPGVDVKAVGGFVVAPPSHRADIGKEYAFVEGGLADFTRLPAVKPGSLPLACEQGPSTGTVPEGKRNITLFSELRQIAYECETLDELLFRAEGFNEALFEVPLPDAEVEGCVAGVWKYRLQGRCFPPGQQYAGLPGEEIDALIDEPTAFALWAFLKRHHMGLRNVFAISTEALAPRLGWGERRLRRAIEVLITRIFIERVHKGGRGIGDAHKYKFVPRGNA